MKIKIYDDAHRRFTARINTGQATNNGKWYALLEAIAGKEIEIETNHLFIDQFNTVPIPGVSENGARIMISMVEYVIDDERYGKMKCRYCGATQSENDKCIKCGKNDYLFIFDKTILDYQQKPNKKG